MLFSYFFYKFHLDILLLFHLQQTEWVCEVTWLPVAILFGIDPLYGQNTVIPNHQSSLLLGTHADPDIFGALKQIWLSRSTYKITSYVDFAPYLNSFSKFETYLVNFITDLNSPNIKLVSRKQIQHVSSEEDMTLFNFQIIIIWHSSISKLL